MPTTHVRKTLNADVALECPGGVPTWQKVAERKGKPKLGSLLAMVEPRPSHQGSLPALNLDRWLSPFAIAIATPSRMSAALHPSRGPKHLRKRYCVHSFLPN